VRPTESEQGEQDVLSDEEVVRRVRAGQAELFEVLMRRYNQRVYRLARSVLPNDHEAEEVAQEAWVRAYEHLDQFAGRAAFPTWLSRIALHEAWARARRARRLQPIATAGEGESHEMMPTSTGPDPETETLGGEMRSLLEAAVGALPETYRTVFMLRHVEELSTAETAELLELTEEAVKTRLHRARAALQKALLAKAGGQLPLAFSFLGTRCDRMVASVLLRIAGGAAEPN
jgi:RNA polymerase sigma-70 factor (ECF subfamily)